ncbi:hypothetical protein GUITHDRAFT_115747 [Guillardia theta CCMP2712]|uniref:Hcy-binding domain-containing protein n=1 Tax=Guillardia theta (strain CCMP2712) TaxID=905079 RepID=L1IQ40_GUITC|nr:hypothetical protein GUITHDRAFT_115747 [Guillardia theta CCMP2712]EKX38202.1 hypothetical protein GUITHDRAFT_115747 [Guillardia theta CCMP2712]|eukprot:XP_005825182.1 hypothetical protein GUITHDRAFT_115747 [Guillardia theta CCMP2712]
MESYGADLSGHLWSARLLRDDPALIKRTHAAFYMAGSDLATSASYQATVAGGRMKPFAAASVGCYGASLADGSEYTGIYDIGKEEVKAFHLERLKLLVKEEPDVLAFETIPNLMEVEAILDVLNHQDVSSSEIPAWISVCCRSDECLSSGEPVDDFVRLVAARSPATRQLVAVGVNCLHPRYVEKILERMKVGSKLALVVYANKGEEWDAEEKRWMPGTATEDDEYCRMAEMWRSMGANMIGGCCRTSVDTIRMLRQKLVR